MFRKFRFADFTFQYVVENHVFYIIVKHLKFSFVHARKTDRLRYVDKITFPEGINPFAMPGAYFKRFPQDFGRTEKFLFFVVQTSPCTSNQHEIFFVKVVVADLLYFKAVMRSVFQLCKFRLVLVCARNEIASGLFDDVDFHLSGNNNCSVSSSVSVSSPPSSPGFSFSSSVPSKAFSRI